MVASAEGGRRIGRASAKAKVRKPMRCSAGDLLPSTVRIEGYPPTFDGIRSVSARTALMRRLPVGCQGYICLAGSGPGLRFAYLQASDCGLARIVRLRRGSPSPGQL